MRIFPEKKTKWPVTIFNIEKELYRNEKGKHTRIIMISSNCEIETTPEELDALKQKLTTAKITSFPFILTKDHEVQPIP